MANSSSRGRPSLVTLGLAAPYEPGRSPSKWLRDDARLLITTATRRASGGDRTPVVARDERYVHSTHCRRIVPARVRLLSVTCRYRKQQSVRERYGMNDHHSLVDHGRSRSVDVAVRRGEGSDYAVLLLDHCGTVLSWTADAQALYQYTAKEVVGLDFATLCP